MVLIPDDKLNELHPKLRKFPSPCGDYGSYPLTEDLNNIKVDGDCFRPLAGIMVLILIYKVKVKGKTLTPGFPSPCGDYGSYQV